MPVLPAQLGVLKRTADCVPMTYDPKTKPAIAAY
jgi:hypothetical protein